MLIFQRYDSKDKTISKYDNSTIIFVQTPIFHLYFTISPRKHPFKSNDLTPKHTLYNSYIQLPTQPKIEIQNEYYQDTIS